MTEFSFLRWTVLLSHCDCYLWETGKLFLSVLSVPECTNRKIKAGAHPPVRWRPRVVAGTWRQHWWSAAWCPRPRWRGTCHSGSRTWWHRPTTCPESGCSRCCWSPLAPGRPACPRQSAGRTSRRWCGRSRSHTALPAIQNKELI